MTRIEKECAQPATQPALRRGDALPRRPVPPVQVPALPGRAPGVRARDRHRLLRRRPRQLQLPALRPRRVLPARLRGRQAGADAEHYLQVVQRAAPKEGELSFVSGHPGGTSRLLTVASWSTRATSCCPIGCCAAPSCAACSSSSAARPRAEAHQPRHDLFGIENGSRRAAAARRRCSTTSSSRSKAARSERSCAPASPPKPAKPAVRRRLGRRSPAPQQVYRRDLHGRTPASSSGAGFESASSSTIARDLVRAADERAKPNDDAAARVHRIGSCPALKQRALLQAPIYHELEIAAALPTRSTKLREELGADDPVVQARCSARSRPTSSPRELVTRHASSRDVELRKRALSRAARRPSPPSRRPDDPARPRWSSPTPARCASATRTRSRRPMQQHAELIAKARFDGPRHEHLPRRDLHPAPGLRHGQGLRRGRQGGRAVHHLRRRLRARHRQGRRSSCRRAGSRRRTSSTCETPFNFVTDNDIIGGNSG